MGGVKALWEDSIHEVIQDAIHGVLTKREAKKKLDRLIDRLLSMLRINLP